MNNNHFILCDKYLVKDKNDIKSKPERLIAIFSSNKPTSQGKENYYFHAQGKNGVRVISGNRAELHSLKWYQKDTYWAGIIGGIIGFVASLALLGIKTIFSLNG